MKAFILLFLILWVIPELHSQGSDGTSQKNRISIILGHTQIKEENLHPKVFRGAALGIYYAHETYRHNISAYETGVKASLLNTTYEKFPSAINASFRGSYRYLFHMSDNGKLHYFMGPVFDLQYGAGFYFNWDESHLYYANYLSAGLGNRIQYGLGKNALEFSLDIPVLSVISRPEPNRQYKIDDMTFTGVVKNLASNPGLAFMNRNFNVKTSVKWKFKAKGRTQVGYHFLYHFMQAREGELFQHADHSVSYTFIF
jgi:hypothetical protein